MDARSRQCTGRHGGWLLAVVVLALPACGSQATGGQTGEEHFGCQEARSTPLAIDEQSPIGFSAEQGVLRVCGVHDAVLRKDDGTETTLTLSVACDGSSARFIDREWRQDPRGRETLDAGCLDIVTLQADLGFDTADGSFDEQWQTRIEAERVDYAVAWVAIDLSNLNGTYAVTEVDVAQYQELAAFLAIRFEAQDVTGAISGQGTRVSGDNASATNFPIATFD